MKRLPQAQIEEIITLYQDGIKPAVIASKYGIFANSINRIMRKNNIKTKHLLKITDEEVKFILETYQEGISSEYIADVLDRDGSTVCRVLKKNNIQIRPATQNKRKYKINEDFFEKIDTQDKAYFLGLLYADGNLSKRGNSIKILLQKGDREILEKFSNIIYGFTKLYTEIRTLESGEEREYDVIAYYSQKAHSDLIKLGCIPNKTFLLKFPTREQVPDELLPHFIRGYFDGDGCISMGDNKTTIDFTGCLPFLEGVNDYLNNKLGFKCNTYYQRHKDRDNNIRSIQFCAYKNVNVFLKLIYNNALYYLVRKKDIADDFLKIGAKFSEIKNYGTTFIPTCNSIYLSKDNVQKLSKEEKEIVAQKTALFYRQCGFPFTTPSDDELIKEFSHLKELDPNSIINNKILSIQNYTGNNIIKHFSPHFFEATSSYTNKPSMIDAFNNDDLLYKVIHNRLSQNYQIDGNMIKQGLYTSRVAFKASMFNSLIAKFMYSKYISENDIIYDYSIGYGQRLLGALSLPFELTYIGVDPLERSVNSNKNIYDFYNKYIPGLHKNVELICSGSEDYCDDKYINKIKFAFSSPPYFDLEKYEQSEKQAYSNGYVNYIHKYWKNTATNIYKLLKEDGILALNIKDKVGGFSLQDDMINILKTIGFKQIDLYHICLTKNKVFNGNKVEDKFEPIFIFTKETNNEKQ